MNLDSINPMGWTTAPQLRTDLRTYSYGRKYPICAPTGYILPSTFFRAKGPGQIVEFLMIDESGASQNITNNVLPQISVIMGEVQDEIKIIGSSSLTGTYDEGACRFEMTDGVNRWYSDWLFWAADVSCNIKLEYWNDSYLETGPGKVTYPAPFRWRVWLNTELFKPSYQYGDDVRNAANKIFPFRQSSWKRYKFVPVIPEHVIDALSSAPLHHHVTVTHLGIVHNVSELRMSDPDWLTEADLAKVEFNFRASTIRTNFASPVGTAMSSGMQSCLAVEYTAVSFLNDPFSAINAPSKLANTTAGVSGYIIYSNSGFDGGRLYFVPGDAEPYLAQESQGDVIFDQSTGNYYISSSINGGSLLTPRILSIGSTPQYTLTGLVMAGTTITVEARTADNPAWVALSSSYTSTQVNSGVDLGSGIVAGTLEVRLVISTPACGVLFTTAPVAVNAPPQETLRGIGYDTIGTDNDIL